MTTKGKGVKCSVCGIEDSKSVKFYYSSTYGKNLCNTHYLHMKRHGKILERTIYTPNEYVIYENYAEIKMYDKNGQFIDATQVSLDKINMLKNFKWGKDAHGYVTTKEGNSFIKMHRLILNAPNDKQVDHKDRNKLNNRNDNLRLCEPQGNSMNHPIQSNNSSGITGVIWHKLAQKWCARIKLNGKDMHLGLFDNLEDAIITRFKAELKYFGEFFPQNKYSEDIQKYYKKAGDNNEEK